MIFTMTERHHTSTVRWKNSWIGSSLSDASAEGVRFLASAISTSDRPRLFPVGLCERWGLRSANACNLNNLKDRIWTATAKIDQTLLQNVWHKVECRPDMCRATDRAHIELPLGMKKTFWVALYNGVSPIFMCILLSYQYSYVIAHIICNHPVYVHVFQ
jgi:hypothetical protein